MPLMRAHTGICRGEYYSGSEYLQLVELVISLLIPLCILLFVKMERWQARHRARTNSASSAPGDKRFHGALEDPSAAPGSPFRTDTIQSGSLDESTGVCGCCGRRRGALLPVYDTILWLVVAAASVRAAMQTFSYFFPGSFTTDNNAWWFWVMWGLWMLGSRMFIGSAVAFLLIQRSSGRGAFRRALLGAITMTMITGTVSGVLAGLFNRDRRVTLLLITSINVFSAIVFLGVLVYMLRKRRRRWKVVYGYVALQFVGYLLYAVGGGAALVPTMSQDFSCAWTVGDFMFAFIMPFVILATLRDDSGYWRRLGSDVGAAGTGMGPELFEGAIETLSRRSFDDLSEFLGMEVPLLDFTKMELLNGLGSGSSASVFKGRYCGDEIAVKSMDFQELTVDVVRDFCKEAILSFRLKHPNVISCGGVCLQPPDMFLAFEFCRLGSLRNLLDSQIALSPSQRVQLALDVAEGMGFLHGSNVIHRDLKSDNILIQGEPGGRLVAKIADFGLSRMILPRPPAKPRRRHRRSSSTASHRSRRRASDTTPRESKFPEGGGAGAQGLRVHAGSQMSSAGLPAMASPKSAAAMSALMDARAAQASYPGTRTGSTSTTITQREEGMTTAIGTVTYLPPELLVLLKFGRGGCVVVDTTKPTAVYDYTIDVFAFAVVLWEIITRRMPYENCSAAEVQRFVLSGVRMHVPADVSCPKRYRTLMAECWRHEPTRRPGFAAILETLKRVWFHDIGAYEDDEMSEITHTSGSARTDSDYMNVPRDRMSTSADWQTSSASFADRFLDSKSLTEPFLDGKSPASSYQ